MVVAGLIMDVAFTAAGLVPEPKPNIRAELTTFSFNYTFWLNLAFGALAAYFVWLNRKHPMDHGLGHHQGPHPADDHAATPPSPGAIDPGRRQIFSPIIIRWPSGVATAISRQPNVFLAKVGSDMQKPDGLVVITTADLPELLLGLELQEIYGIGACMEQRLHRAGILTVAQLWHATPFQLRRVWGGINGVLFHQMLHGVDIQPPSPRFSEKHRPSAMCWSPSCARRKARMISRSTC
jgi:hypothetical protein